MNHPVSLGKLAFDKAGQSATSQATTKVLHLINGEHFSGAERVQDLLGMSLGQFNYDVGFACLKDGLFPSERNSENELFELNMRSKTDFKAIRRLRKLIVENDYKILHAHTPRTVMAGSLVARKTGCPLVYHVHSPVGRDSTRSFINRINQIVESWSASQVSHFICVSDSIRQYMTELGYSPENMTTVANGVAIVDNVPNRSTPSGTWTLGTTALFRPRKGTECLLEALSMLRKRDMDVRLLAVGPFETEEYELKIKTLAKKLQVEDLIEWTGFVNDVDAYFQRMDAFVLPSLFGEGLPMVLLESMAIGTPVISAEVEGVNQAIRADQDGLIFEPGEAGKLADCVSDSIQGKHDWQAIRSSALQRQRDGFSDTSMARGVADIYDRLLANKS